MGIVRANFRSFVALALLYAGAAAITGAQSDPTSDGLRTVYASDWQGGIAPAVICDTSDLVQLMTSAYIEYYKSQRMLSVTQGQSVYLHGIVAKPDPKDLGCLDVAPGTPMTLVREIYGIPMVRLRISDGTYRTGMTAPWAIRGAAPPCTMNCPAYAINLLKAQYSDLAQKARLEGTIVVSFVIDEQGNSRDIKIESTNLSRLSKPYSPPSSRWPTVRRGQRCPFGYTALVGPEPHIGVCEPANVFTARSFEKRIREQDAAEEREIAQELNSDLSLGLAQKAIEAVSNNRFQAALKDGNPVAVHTTNTLTFKYQDRANTR